MKALTPFMSLVLAIALFAVACGSDDAATSEAARLEVKRELGCFARRTESRQRALAHGPLAFEVRPLGAAEYPDFGCEILALLCRVGVDHVGAACECGQRVWAASVSVSGGRRAAGACCGHSRWLLTMVYWVSSSLFSIFVSGVMKAAIV